jgi:type I restriction enzyme S subunit
MVNMGEIFTHDRIQNIRMDRVPLDGKEREMSLLERGDLLFARQSLVLEGAGKCSVFLGDKEPVTFESHLIRARLDPAIADPLFFFYFFRSPVGRDAIRSIVEQVAAAGIRGRDLANLPVPQIPVRQQRAIARILGTLDDKIELNRRMNETLEEMARAIFKSWFVDFDPVRAKVEGRDPGLPEHIADLFPDRFEDSEMGEIPAGWRVGTLGEVVENPRRSIKPARMDESTPYIGLEHMPRRSISLADWNSSENLESNKYEFERGEILFGKLRPYFHKVGIAPVDGVCSTDILVVAAKQPEWFAFILEHVSSEDFVNYTTATSSGTKMPRTNWKDMSGFDLVIPTLSLAKAFNVLIKPFVECVVENIHEARTLSSLRDTLLPKLISGEMRAGKSEQFIKIGVT